MLWARARGILPWWMPMPLRIAWRRVTGGGSCGRSSWPDRPVPARVELGLAQPQLQAVGGVDDVDAVEAVDLVIRPGLEEDLVDHGVAPEYLAAHDEQQDLARDAALAR